MQTRNVVSLIIVVGVIPIFSTFLILNANQSPQGQAFAAPASTPDAQAANKADVLAYLNKQRQTQKKQGIDAFKKVMRDTPPYVIIGTSGYPFAQRGEYEKAMQVCQEDINQNPDILGPRYTLAWTYAKIGNYDKALDVCNEALKKGPAYNSVRILMAWIYGKQGKFDDALKVCDDALQADPAAAMFYYSKARIQELNGQTDQAIKNYKKAISIKPDFYDAFIFLAVIYSEQGKYDDAIKMDKQAINADKFKAGGYLGLGLVYDEMGNYQSALEMLQKALSLGSFGSDVQTSKVPLALSIGIDDAVIFNRVGVLNLRMGNYPEALTAFNSSIAARSDYGDSYVGIVFANLLMNNKEAAQKAYDRLQNVNADLAKSISSFMK